MHFSYPIQANFSAYKKAWTTHWKYAFSAEMKQYRRFLIYSLVLIAMLPCAYFLEWSGAFAILIYVVPVVSLLLAYFFIKRWFEYRFYQQNLDDESYDFPYTYQLEFDDTYISMLREEYKITAKWQYLGFYILNGEDMYILKRNTDVFAIFSLGEVGKEAYDNLLQMCKKHLEQYDTAKF